MRISRPQIKIGSTPSPLNSLAERLRARLRGEDLTLSVDWLDVAIRTLAVVTGLVLSLLGYGRMVESPLKVGLSRSLLLVGACALVYAALTTVRPTPAEAIHLPALAVGITSLLMVAVTAVFMKRALEVEERKAELEERTAGQLRLLNNLTRVVLSGSPNLESVMRTVASVSSQALEADSGLVMLFEPSRDTGNAQGVESQHRLRLIVSDQDPNPARLSPSEARVSDRAVRTQAPVLIVDARADSLREPGDRFPGLERRGVQVRTVACVPLLLSGGVIGVLFVARFGQRSFTEAEVNLLTAIGQQMAVAVRLARLYEMECE